MTTLSLGYSPCPNDTFIFYALVHQKVCIEGFSLRERLEDVETLNQLASQGQLDITKISFHAFAHLRDQYTLLRSGGALGKGCGPLLVARQGHTSIDLRRQRVAIPGELTTAFLLLRLYDPSVQNIVIMPFHQILRSVQQGRTEIGLIIHESRFTYQHFGLQKILDLGNWWEQLTGYPIPLGGIIMKRRFTKELSYLMEDKIRQSIRYAQMHSEEPQAYISMHAQEMEESVIRQHIDLYVNEYSLDIGPEGEQAIRFLYSEAEKKGLIPCSRYDIF
ncbi:MAG: 1,4-dihydroxy-6-naphthoate synthase [Nitrospirae bacterium]|jgi:1,4-dihydroxy-6-naphthoate synthase|nr:1,4-dihydroxy-6-naphthoate synthase [Nitrospirota bacterium]